MGAAGRSMREATWWKGRGREEAAWTLVAPFMAVIWALCLAFQPGGWGWGAVLLNLSLRSLEQLNEILYT